MKDLGTLVAGLARLRPSTPSARLVVVGSGGERAALETIIRDSGCADAIHMLGYRPDVRALLPGLDVYVNSSVSEGISLTILEAMAAGLPVVATRVGGTPEVVLHGTTGLLFEARNSQALADALTELARRPDLRHVLGAAGRQRVEACFTIERMVTDYAREYERLERR